APEDAVVRRLQRDVEVRAAAGGLGEEAHERLRHLVRVDRRQPETRHGAALDDRPDQPDEIDGRAQGVAPAAEMDAREHDLLEPRRAERVDLPEDLAGREAPTRPARHRDDAERAEEVAPLLDLEKGTRLSRERARPER